MRFTSPSRLDGTIHMDESTGDHLSDAASGMYHAPAPAAVDHSAGQQAADDATEAVELPASDAPAAEELHTMEDGGHDHHRPLV